MNILFLYKHKRSFVDVDYQILSKHHNVTPFYFSGFACIPKLLLEIRKADVIFIWFASYHTFITSLLTKKPKIIVTGGYDVAGESKINYGLMLSPIWRRMVSFILNRASTIISVSQFNKKELEEHLGIGDSKVVYNCVDSDKFKPSGKKDTNMIITVGYIKEETWIRKGFSKFVELARYSKEQNAHYQFVVVGKVEHSMKDTINKATENLDNITFLGYVSDEKLISLYQKAKVYCQLSYYESYGIAPAEAMLCNCIPIVTNRTALPEVVGDKGFKVPYNSIYDTFEALEEASSSKKRPRKHIINSFSLKKREEEIERILDEYTN